MKDMLTDWAFWSPILKYTAGIVGYFGLLYALPHPYDKIVAIGVVVLMFLGSLLYMGKLSYDIRQSQIKSNYKKLTGKDYDEE